MFSHLCSVFYWNLYILRTFRSVQLMWCERGLSDGCAGGGRFYKSSSATDEDCGSSRLVSAARLLALPTEREEDGDGPHTAPRPLNSRAPATTTWGARQCDPSHRRSSPSAAELFTTVQVFTCRRDRRPEASRGDCETFRTSTLMPKRTIRTSDEGE